MVENECNTYSAGYGCLVKTDGFPIKKCPMIAYATNLEDC
jgi:hypothetical protein